MMPPVSYNIDISLYVITKNQEDSLQIIEQILPIFTPEYTMSVKVVPEMNVIQDIPVIFNSVPLLMNMMAISRHEDLSPTLSIFK